MPIHNLAEERQVGALIGDYNVMPTGLDFYAPERWVDDVLFRPEVREIRVRLGWEPGILNGEGGKPKWMRWRTFERLTAQHSDMVGRTMQAIAIKFGIAGDLLN